MVLLCEDAPPKKKKKIHKTGPHADLVSALTHSPYTERTVTYKMISDVTYITCPWKVLRPAF